MLLLWAEDENESATLRAQLDLGGPVGSIERIASLDVPPTKPESPGLGATIAFTLSSGL